MRPRTVNETTTRWFCFGTHGRARGPAPPAATLNGLQLECHSRPADVQYANSVAMHGDLLVVGDSLDDEATINAGAVHV